MKRAELAVRGHAVETAAWGTLAVINMVAAAAAPTAFRRQVHAALAAGFAYSAARSFVREQVFSLFLDLTKESEASRGDR